MPYFMEPDMIRKNTFCPLFFYFLIAFSCALSRAQTAGTGTITGLVTDTSGAAVPNATVVITNTDTSVSRTIQTNNDGSYSVTFLQPGHYEVVLGGGGFGKFDQKDINLTVGRTLAINASLAAANVSTEVIVSSAPPVLDTQKTEVSQTVGQQLISNLPVNGRRWDDFVLLTPNVVPDGGSGLVSFHGISGLYNQNFVDGANNNQMLFSEARGRASGAPYVYSLDSIKEFEAETSNYSAEFGQAAGGQVNAITRSGANATHGDLFYSLRYPSFNALDPFSKWTALHNHGNPFLLTQPIHQQQQFGGSAGGPIIKDKLFYFFTYDGFRRVGRVLYYTTDTVSLTPSGTTSSTTTITPTQCPTTISSTQCNSAIEFIQQLAGVNINPPSRYAKENIFFPRLDYDLNSKNHFFVNFNFANFDSTNGYSPNPTYSNSSISTNGPTSYHERFLIANWTSAITNNSINEVRFQWGRDLETAGANAPGPSVSINGLETYGMPNALPRLAEPDEHRYQITDIFSTQKGRHTFKFGGDANIVHEVMVNLFQGGGIYSYSGTPLQAFQNWAVDAFRGEAGDTAANQGTHYTTFVQTIDAINPLSRAGGDDFYMQMYDGFAEDTWKIRHNLVLNLGVRYDFQLTPNPAKPNTSSAIAAFYNTTIKNVSDRVQPRIGFAWNPQPGTVVRGGYGLFSALNQGSTYYAMRVENGIYQINYSFNGGTTTPVLFPDVPFAVTGPPLSAAIYPTGGTAPTVAPLTGGKLVPSFHGLSPDFVPPNAHEMSLSVEQLLPGKLTLSVGYVGTRALHLPVFIDANLVGQTPHGSRSYNVENAEGAVTSIFTTPFYLPSDRSNTTLGSLNTGFSVANSWYHSMATTIRRPFDHGLELLVNYTWSKALDDDQVAGAFGTFYGGNPVQDPNNIRGEYGRSDLDVRNRFVGSVVYQPMIFKDNRYVKYLLDDFIFSGIATEQTGFPIAALLSGFPSGGADGGVTGGVMSSGSGTATAGRPPQIQRNSQPGPGTRNIDFRISRDFPIHEGMHFQITGEAFNLLNARLIAGVNSTYFTFTAPNATTCAGSGVDFGGCLGPFVSATSGFGTPNSTNNLIFGPRQLQVSARFSF
jgi:Carboxypeptidase regulatory-like domain/TonB dependent receptor